MGSRYLKRPMSVVELRQVASAHGAIRTKLSRLARLEQRPDTDADREDIMSKLVLVATKIGNARSLMGESNPYPHPMLVAEWTEAVLEDPRMPTFVLSEEMQPAVLGPIGATFRVPNREITEWARVYERTTGEMRERATGENSSDTRLPHWFRTSVNVTRLDAPEKAALRGFRLSRIELVVPTGTMYLRVGNTQRFVSAPVGARTITIDCDTGSQCHAHFGEVWFAIGKNRRGLQLASQRLPKLDLEDFLRVMGAPGKVAKLSPKRRVPFDSVHRVRLGQQATQLGKYEEAVRKLRGKSITTEGAKVLGKAVS